MTMDQRSAGRGVAHGHPPETATAMSLLSGEGMLPVMCWRWSVPGDPGQARRVRERARALLDDHPAEADILTVASELFANAVRHTASGRPGGLVSLEIRRWRQRVTVAVADQGGPDEPALRTVGETLDGLAEGGRGLLTVAAYASRWCWRGDSTGRTVTAFFGE